MNIIIIFLDCGDYDEYIHRNRTFTLQIGIWYS